MSVGPSLNCSSMALSSLVILARRLCGAQVAPTPFDTFSRPASAWSDQPELDRGGGCSSVLSDGCLSNVLGHMTVEDLRPVFEGQGLDSAAWQELLSLQQDTQLEIRLVQDSSGAADLSPQDLHFPLSALLSDDMVMQQLPASDEASSLAKLAQPILSWLDAQSDAAAADSIEVIAHQIASASYEVWDDGADHADAYWQWQDALTCTEHQPSCQPLLDVEVCPDCSQHDEAPAACLTQSHSCPSCMDPMDADAWSSPDTAMSIASAQQQVVASSQCSNCDTTSPAPAAAAPIDEYWHPDTDLAALQHKLQHVKSGAQSLSHALHAHPSSSVNCGLRKQLPCTLLICSWSDVQ